MTSFKGAIVDSDGFIDFKVSVTANTKSQAEDKMRVIAQAMTEKVGTKFFFAID